MNCENCGMSWCYCCGMSEADADKAPREGSASQEPLYGHNEDWQTNKKRCPMVGRMGNGAYVLH